MKRFNENLLKQVGGWHIIVMTLVSQLAGLLGGIPGFISLRLITEFDIKLSQIFSSLIPILIIVSQTLMLAICWFSTPNARSRLSELRKSTGAESLEKVFAAWREATNFTTLYGISSFFINFIVIILPLFYITLARRNITSFVFQSTSINLPVPYYIFLSGLASVLGILILTLLIIERLMFIDRLILLPKDFETQLNARTGALLGVKFQSLILGLLIIGIATIAPLGYQQIVMIFNTDTNPVEMFRNLQIQSLLLVGLVLFLGIAFSLLATRSMSKPIRELIEAFQKVEKGDLSPRIEVTATDELAVVAIHFNHMITRLDQLQSTLEELVVERTKQLTATNEVGRVASSILDPDELLSKVVSLITEQFRYYYAAIYLLDASGKWAELKEATGSAGNVLKQNRHRLEVSGKSMVAGCIREKMPRLALNTADEKQRFENPLLPYTRSEIALPLITGNRVLGALNVQSTKPSDFGSDVIETMQNMASQVAGSLENARLFQDAQQSIKDLRAIQKQYLLEGWTNIRSYNEDLEYGMGEPSEIASHVMENSIELRDQTLGQITLERSEEWSPELQSLVDAVTAQVAIAMENARLVSESRQVALRERTLAEINAKVWASTSIDTILQTVVKELGKRLDVSNASIELKMEDNS